jgi:hypothetical protein
MKKKRRVGAKTILRRMRKAAEQADQRGLYDAMAAAMPFERVWECVSFLAEHGIYGHRKTTVLRRIDLALSEGDRS